MGKMKPAECVSKTLENKGLEDLGAGRQFWGHFSNWALPIASITLRLEWQMGHLILRCAGNAFLHAVVVLASSWGLCVFWNSRVPYCLPKSILTYTDRFPLSGDSAVFIQIDSFGSLSVSLSCEATKPWLAETQELVHKIRIALCSKNV